MTSVKTAALIVAGGSGERMGSELPKQYWELCGIPVIARTLHTFIKHANIDETWIVIHPDHQALLEKALTPDQIAQLAGVIEGGKTRQASVYAGLQAMNAMNDPPDHVLIHDAVRPFASNKLIERIASKIQDKIGAIPALPAVDTLKKVENGEVQSTVSRAGLMTVQTPQGFPFQMLLKAHQEYESAQATDDASLIELAGGNIRCIEGESLNLKLTTMQDWHQATMQQEAAMEIRTGQGYDVHRLIEYPQETLPENQVVHLGGVAIPHPFRLKGHSDADVLLHAVVDALLGAMGEGDIGQHFPDTDSKYKGMNSSFFLEETYNLLKNKEGRIVNLDITLICEAPKIVPHRPKIIKHIAEILRVNHQRINLKATTTEGLGFTGRKEGIAASAIATIILPKLRYLNDGFITPWENY